MKIKSITSRERAWRTVALQKTNEPTPRKDGLPPPGPCSQGGRGEPSGWARRRESRPPDTGKPRGEPRGSQSRGWERRRVPRPRGTAALGLVLPSAECGSPVGSGATGGSWSPGPESGARPPRQLPRMLIPASP